MKKIKPKQSVVKLSKYGVRPIKTIVRTSKKIVSPHGGFHGVL